ncbi:MAG: hypothetical protein J0H85_04425 [Sediminibacterium magnilacihabitans]|jgi:hypothetical protein|nr:hypothetical protein [Sediminibacterium magnilacihabitans]PQV61855.1 hypothetical protein CLV53_101129 [Sediminibacterium magnilacihabitans]
MKKCLVTILAFIYLISAVGATVHLHYCMDKLVAWGFVSEKNNEKVCSYCGMAKSAADKHCVKESKGCCKDEQKIVKLENDQKVSDVAFQFTQIFSDAISHSFSDYAFEYASSLTEKFPVTHAPPRTQGVSLFVRNCVFRI